MGALSKLFRRRRKNRRNDCCHTSADGNTRRLRFETMESRRVLSADPLFVGAVYYEADTGGDDGPDIFEVTFVGGTDNTQLTDFTIELNPQNPALRFDTLSGGGQPPNHFGFQFDPSLSQGIAAADILGVSVADGGTTLKVDVNDFHKSDKLVFSIDVDHIVGRNGDPIASGAEFELSTLDVNFSDPNFAINRFQPALDPADPAVRAGLNGTEDGIFWDFYDGNFAGKGIQQTNDIADKVGLPADDFEKLDPNNIPVGQHDRTAGVLIGLELEPLPVTICGTVFHDRNMNLVQDPGDEGIEDVKLFLLKEDANGVFQAVEDAAGNAVFAETDVFGDYCFGVNDGLNLLPGTYRVVEEQPVDFPISVGAIPGEVVPGSGNPVGSVVGTNAIDVIAIPLGNTDAVNYDFAEAKPVEIHGNVHLQDANGDCFGPGDPDHRPIEDAVVYLVSEHGAVLKTETDANGDYWFSSNDLPAGTFLLPGSYTLIEVTPDGLLDGPDLAGTVNGVAVGQTPGSTPTSIPLANGSSILVSNIVAANELNRLDFVTNIELESADRGVEYDFCEGETASLSGHVYEDFNDNGIRETGEAPIRDVTVALFDAAGNVAGQQRTDASGFYEFQNLTPGVYKVVETHPTEYFDGKDAAGTINGATVGTVVRFPDATGVIRDDDLISDIQLGFGQHSIDNDFGELPPSSLSGFVYHDLNNDGVFDPNEAPIAGVPIELRLTFANNGLTLLTPDHVIDQSLLDSQGRYIVTTDANGFYEFTGIRGGLIETSTLPLFGNYAVYETVQPATFDDGLESAGSTTGLADNANHPTQPANSPFAQSLINTHSANGARTGDLLFLVPVGVNATSVNNNFGEILPPPTGDPCLEPECNSLPPDRIPPNDTPLPPPGLPPIQRFIPPPIIPIPPAEPMETFGGGGDYTWHLSVIDAGHPRGDDGVDNSDAGIWYTASYLNPHDWEASDLREAKWRLESVSFIAEGDEIDHVARELIFGIHGATPVTGDFNGDGVDEVGVFYKGEWFVDLNGNGRWDDADLWARLGRSEDRPVTGDWDGDGKDDIGIFGPIWAGDPRAIEYEPGLPDSENVAKALPKNVPPTPAEATDGNRVLRLTEQGPARADLIDHVFRYGRAKDVPIAGDWNGDGISAIGLFREGKWILDTDGDGRWSKSDAVLRFGQPGDLPVIGDFNGDGIDDVGIYRGGTWMIDTNGNRELDAHDKVFELGGADDRPVVGDWNGDGIDDPAVYREVENVEQARR